ncbi:hypothetical protein MTR_7g011540 [Medicago truncatula]|uniref:Uncharacterized protein n=1 Tax=Medicago truncatula TaxID=3880 RepID=G7L323_MEDTR|nr:hypothetical protein MTR_7g011540 [Medicago truncatula]
MSQEMLNALAILCIEKDMIEHIDVEIIWETLYGELDILIGIVFCMRSDVFIRLLNVVKSIICN